MTAESSSRGTALLVVDVQIDFCEDGSLPVDGGTGVARRVAAYLETHADRYAAIATTRDWHIEPGRHFASAMGKDAEPDFVQSWPDHCVAGTEGVEYHPELSVAVGRHVQAEFRKGRYEAAYSAFEGTLSKDDEASLLDWLLAREIEAVDIVGIATDYCVRATALDALSAGLHTTVLTDLVAGVAEESSRAALDELDRSGVYLATSQVALSSCRTTRPAPLGAEPTAPESSGQARSGSMTIAPQGHSTMQIPHPLQ